MRYLSVINKELNTKTMTIIAQNSEFKVEFNGSATYMIVDSQGTCWMIKDTERKAMNYFSKVTKQCGVV